MRMFVVYMCEVTVLLMRVFIVYVYIRVMYLCTSKLVGESAYCFCSDMGVSCDSETMFSLVHKILKR